MSNRELAGAIWGTLVFLWIVWESTRRPELLEALWHVIVAAVQPRLVIFYCLLAGYLWLEIKLIDAVGLLFLGGWWPIVRWGLFSGLAMAVAFVSSHGKQGGVVVSVLSGAKVGVWLEWFLGIYVFSIWVELVLVPVAVVLSCLLVVAKRTPGSSSAVGCFGFLSSMLVLMVLVYSIWSAVLNPKAIVELKSLWGLFLPIVLSVFFSPFLVLIGAWASYETIRASLPIYLESSSERRMAMLCLAFRCWFDSPEIIRVGRRMHVCIQGGRRDFNKMVWEV